MTSDDQLIEESVLCLSQTDAVWTFIDFEEGLFGAERDADHEPRFREKADGRPLLRVRHHAV